MSDVLSNVKLAILIEQFNLKVDEAHYKENTYLDV